MMMGSVHKYIFTPKDHYFDKIHMVLSLCNAIVCEIDAEIVNFDKILM